MNRTRMESKCVSTCRGEIEENNANSDFYEELVTFAVLQGTHTPVLYYNSTSVLYWSDLLRRSDVDCTGLYWVVLFWMVVFHYTKWKTF